MADNTKIVMVDPQDRSFSYIYNHTVIPHTNDIVYIKEMDAQFRVERMLASTDDGVILIGALLKRNLFYREFVDIHFNHIEPRVGTN